MSTRSNIAIQKPDGTILSIYVHSDGYPDGVGQCLIDNYKTYISAEKLFRYGDASYLGSTLKECSFYHRDWQRELDKAHVHKNFESFKKYYAGDIFIEFVYLYKDGQWLVSDNYRKPELELVPVKEHKDYSGKKSGITEVEMISQIGKALSGAGFKDEDISMQTFASKKNMN
jgi:hypothetical protein